MQTVPFLRTHLKDMDVRAYEAEHLVPFLSSEALGVMESSSWSRTLLEKDKVVSCIGALPLWSGVWEVWQIPSIHVHKYVKSYCRTILNILDEGAGREKAWRLQSMSPADELHDRWMKFIGFECEGTLKEYSRNKQDFRMWARRYNYGC